MSFGGTLPEIEALLVCESHVTTEVVRRRLAEIEHRTDDAARDEIKYLTELLIRIEAR